METENNNWISFDGKQINLPVPIDTVVYQAIMGCENLCERESEKFNHFFPNKKRKCLNMPCLTKIHTIRAITLTLDNISFVMSRWGKTIFATRDEAEEKMKLLIKENIETMKSINFAEYHV